ncbi:MAG TPA: hypothetical protein VK669_01165 [Candidatus Limnocylindrales bacterium]|nr:hypothetical protein [Candidatus Limnocylindrales bacterium]
MADSSGSLNLRQTLRWVLDWIESNGSEALIEGSTGIGAWLENHLPSTPTVGIVVARGNRLRGDLFPFNAGLDKAVNASGVSSVREIAQSTLPHIAKAIPTAGLAASSVIETFFGRRAAEVTKSSRALDQNQRDVMLALESFAKARRLVLVLDDLQSWDGKSLDLLSEMLQQPKINLSLPR